MYVPILLGKSKNCNQIDQYFTQTLFYTNFIRHDIIGRWRYKATACFHLPQFWISYQAQISALIIPFKKRLFTVEAVHKKDHKVSEMLRVSSYAGLHFQNKQGNLQTVK